MKLGAQREMLGELFGFFGFFWCFFFVFCCRCLFVFWELGPPLALMSGVGWKNEEVDMPVMFGSSRK